ncbi:MAG TPA: HDOD domain-containing protein [Methylobacter sp.]|jgi:HD-like signal output (HDOD) protein
MKIVSENISMPVVQELFPIRNYDTEKLLAFTSDLKSEVFPKQTTLFRYGNKTDSALYLLKGTVSLSDGNGKTYEIVGGTREAKFPLSSGDIYTTTAVAKTDVSVLRVSQKILSPKYAPLSQFSKLVIPDELTDNHLLVGFFHHYNNEELSIPSLPDVAIKLRDAMNNDDVGIADVVKIIQHDPVFSAKLIGLANCPLYLGVTPVKSCFEAVNRIGLNATRNLVISLSMNRIFKTNSPLIKKYLDEIWKESLSISIISFVLASITKQVNPEEALLAGLICNIGAVPFLSFAANLPKDYYTESDIEAALTYVKGPVGYKVLNDWGFVEEYLKIPLYSEDWYQNNSEKLNLTDIVVLSRLHNKIGQKNTSELPVISSVPAASKLKNFSLSPELSLNVLHEAKQKINETMKAFSN